MLCFIVIRKKLRLLKGDSNDSMLERLVINRKYGELEPSKQHLEILRLFTEDPRV